MTTIMENSGIYKKALCSNGICNGDGRAVRLLSQSHAGEDHKSRIKAVGHPAKCLLAAGGCGIVVGSPTLFECQPH